MKYKPGKLRVVAYGEDGKVIGEQTVATAGKPKKLVLEADRTILHANGNDLAFVTVSMTDAKGTFCPTLSDNLTFEVSGAATFEAACNGDATSLHSFRQPEMPLFSGKAVVIVRSNGQHGPITLTVHNKQRNLSKTISLRAE